MHLNYSKIALAFATLALTGTISANSILVYGTGLDNSNNLLSGGAVDPHYTLVSSPDVSYPGPSTYVVLDGFPIGGGAWVNNGPASKWIAPSPTTGPNGNADGDYDYQTTFSLAGLDWTTAILMGQWATDNAGVQIYLNGQPTGNSIPFGTPGNYSFTQLTPFTIASGFVPGVNTLDFVVNNFPNNGGINPTGLRVDLSGTANALTAAPEPGTLVLFLGSGLLLCAGRRRRR